MIRLQNIITSLALFLGLATVLILLCGCGHTVFTSAKGVGIDISWNPDTFAPSLRGGEYNVQTFVPRGNSSMTMTSSTGGVLGTGGTAQSITVATGIQLNEGNIQKILTSPTMSDEAKISFTKELSKIIKEPVTSPETSSRTTYAASATGKDSIQIKPELTGTDKIVQEISDNAGNIKDVAVTTVETVGDVGKTGITATILSTKWVLIIGIIGIVLIIIAIVALFKFGIPWIIDLFKTKTVKGTSIVGKIQVENIPENQDLSTKK